jgi:hypothetical protein
MDLRLLAPTGVFSAARARDVGLSRSELRRLLRDRHVVRLHRGWYAVGGITDGAHLHALRLDALLQEYAGIAVATGASALIRLGLPTFRPDLRRVHLALLEPAMHRHRKDDLVVHPARRPPDGLEPTGTGTVHPAVALVEAGLSDPRSLLVPADAALRRSLVTATDLESALAPASGRRGVAGLRAVLDWCDARHESPGETLTAHVLRMLGHAVEPQFVVPGTGEWTARGQGYRADFRIVGTRVLVEFDGRQKYARGSDLWGEKLREDRIRSLGWEVVRLTWRDLRDPAPVRRRIEEALARAGR